MRSKGPLFLLFVGLIAAHWSVKLAPWKAPAPEPVLSGSVTQPLKPSTAQRIQYFQNDIDQTARRYGLDPALVTAVIVKESGGNPYAVSGAGAVGIMQFMPATAAQYGLIRTLPNGETVDERTDPKKCMDAGCRYLKYLYNFMRPHAATHEDAVALALAGYNAGEGRVQKLGWKIPPISETQDYVTKIMRMWLGSRSSQPPSHLETIAER